MKIKIFVISFLFLGMVSCNKNVFHVNVNVKNADNQLVYLQQIQNGTMVDLDSVVLKNGQANFKVAQNENLDAYHIFIKGWKRALPFFADNKDVTITGDYQNYYDIQIVASETQAKLDAFTKRFNEFDAKVEEADKLLREAKKNGNESDIQAAEFAKDDANGNMSYFVYETVTDNSADVLSPYILYRYKWLFELCELRQAVASFKPELKSGYYDKMKEYIVLQERVDVGQPYLDFTLNDANGNPVTLSSLVGKSKLLMIDFWASWCPDCRKENPNVVAAYNDFHDKGLDILSVSLDTDKKSWLAAIEKDGLVWNNHLSDLQGWSNTASVAYGVAFIPQNVIIDESGKIIAKNLEGNMLREFVEEYLK